MWGTRQTRASSHGRLLSETARRADVPRANQTEHPDCPASFIDTLSGVFGRPLWSGNSILWGVAADPVTGTVQASGDDLTSDGRQLEGAINVVQDLRLASPDLSKVVLTR